MNRLLAPEAGPLFPGPRTLNKFDMPAWRLPVARAAATAASWAAWWAVMCTLLAVGADDGVSGAAAGLCCGGRRTGRLIGI